MRTMLSNYIRRWAAALVVALTVVPINTATAAEKNCGSVERLATALRLLQVVYPELKGKEVSISLSTGHGNPFNAPTDAATLGVLINAPLWQPATGSKGNLGTSPSSSREADGVLPLPLYLDVNFVRSGTDQREISCRPLKFTNDKAGSQFRKAKDTIDAHPEWTDAQELEMARTLGLRYGPEDKATILRMLPLEGLSMIYGPLQIKRATFSMNIGQKCQGCSFVAPSWEITISEVGTSRSLLIVVDPFVGKITSISE